MSVEKNNLTGRPEEPDLIDPGPENVIPLDLVRMQMRRKLFKTRSAVKSEPGLCNLDYLADANVDVAKAMQFCEIMGIDMTPIKNQMKEEINCADFYAFLHDYLSAIELCLIAGMDMGQNVILMHSNRELARAAVSYTVGLSDDKRSVNVLQVMKKMKVWLSQKIEEDL